MNRNLEKLVKFGIKFPKKDVRFPKEWQKLKESVYNGESNYAVLTGEVNNILVVDLDNKDPTFKGIQQLHVFNDINSH